VIAVNPNKGPQINTALTETFIDWIISLPVQEKISQYGVDEFGQALFVPDSAAWREKK
jgi:tungstate transport system substrate-binding protein